ALGGASAGGNLAAAATLSLAHECRAPAASLLLYPVLHPLRLEPTAEEAAAVADLAAMLRFSLETTRSFTDIYLGRPVSEACLYDFPGLAGTAQLAARPRTALAAEAQRA